MELFLGAVALSSLALGWCVWALDRRASRPRVIAITRAADAKNGELAKLSGRVEIAGRPLVAPISGRPCAYYEITIHIAYGADPKAHLVAQERYARDFSIRDETGVACVEVRAARFVLARPEPSLRSSDDAAVRRILERHGYDLGAFEGLTFYCDERAIGPGDELFVLGCARFERNPSRRSYRDEAPRLVIEAPEEGTLLATDDPHGC